MNEAGLERNENIFRFTNPKGRLRNRLGDALRWPALVRVTEAPGNAPLWEVDFPCQTAMSFSSAAIATRRSSSCSLTDVGQRVAARTGPPFKLAASGRRRRDIGCGHWHVIRTNWTGSRAVRLKAKAAQKVLAVTEVE